MARPFVAIIAATIVLGAGCIADPASRDQGHPCSEPALAEDGSTLSPTEPYWTLASNDVPMHDAQARVDEVPGIVVKVDGVEVPTVTRAATIDGEDWVERWWACRLAETDPVPAVEGSHFGVLAESDQAQSIRMAFLFGDCDGTLIGYGHDPDWHADGHFLSERIAPIRTGSHDVLTTVRYPDGTSRTHHFQVAFNGGCP